MTDRVPNPPNRATRRAEARRARRVTALGSGVVLATSVVGLAVSSAPAGATDIVVTNLNDSGPGSLRQALADASDGDTIDLRGLSGTITLTSGQLDIEDAVTILGPGPDVLAISGNNASRVFSMYGSLTGTGTVTISGLTIRDGNQPDAKGNTAGGGIFFNCEEESDASLVVSNVVITGNTADDLGGGLYFDNCPGGSLTITNSVVSDNTSTGSGAGGVWFDEGVTMLVTNSTIAGNRALGYGGGGVTFDDGEQLVIRNSTVSGNSAARDGGGLYLTGDIGSVTITNSTIAGNSAAENGGGIQVDNFFYLTIVQSTISGNTAGGSGDGLYLTGYSIPDSLAVRGNQDDADEARGTGSDRRVELTGTIVAGNHDGTDDIATDGIAEVTAASSVLGSLGSGIQLIDDGGNQTSVTNPGLAPLADNGGPTRTMALLPGSPAIDAGPDPLPAFSGNEYDQRGPGYPRVVNGRVDVGAFEVQPPEVILLQPNFTG